MIFRNLVVRNKDFNFFKLSKLGGSGATWAVGQREQNSEVSLKSLKKYLMEILDHPLLSILAKGVSGVTKKIIDHGIDKLDDILSWNKKMV